MDTNRAREHKQGCLCRKEGLRRDYADVSDQQEPSPECSHRLLALYEEALPHVYGYMLSRSGNAALAEDLTADTFLAAAAAVRSGTAPTPTTGWLTGIARHKLADHWRHVEREQRALRRAHGGEVPEGDPWNARLDVIRAREVLAGLRPQHRAALTLRHADGLSVPLDKRMRPMLILRGSAATPGGGETCLNVEHRAGAIMERSHSF